jgi:hypothetical protein
MNIEIFRVAPKVAEFAQAAAPYSFKPQHADDIPVLLVEVPAGWFLAGEPEPMLVRRISLSEFTSRSATEVFYHGLGRMEGFVAHSLAGAEPDHQAAAPYLAAIGVVEATGQPELPAPAKEPSRNGKAKVPAKRS